MQSDVSANIFNIDFLAVRGVSLRYVRMCLDLILPIERTGGYAFVDVETQLVLFCS